MIPKIVVAGILLAGAELGPPILADGGWVLWIENTGTRTIVDAQKKTREGREPITWTVHDGYDSLAECRAAIREKFSGLPQLDVDAILAGKPLPRGMYIINNQTSGFEMQFPNGEKLHSQDRHLCLPGTIDPREHGNSQQ